MFDHTVPSSDTASLDALIAEINAGFTVLLGEANDGSAERPLVRPPAYAVA